jgi:uncharacterized cupin superfamily protein
MQWSNGAASVRRPCEARTPDIKEQPVKFSCLFFECVTKDNTDGLKVMTDSTVKKIDSHYSPKGAMGQKYLASGKKVSMRLWQDEDIGEKEISLRDYETVGYVIAGKAELSTEGQVVVLSPGDSWVVPAGASHSYRIIEPFTAIEATAPPAEVHGRDE